MKVKLTLAELHQIFDALDVAEEFYFANVWGEDELSPEETDVFEAAQAKITWAIQTYNQ